MKSGLIVGILLITTCAVAQSLPREQNPRRASAHVHVQPDKQDADNESLVMVIDYMQEALRRNGVVVARTTHSQSPVPAGELLAKETDADYLLLLTATLSGLRRPLFISFKEVNFRVEAYDISGRPMFNDHMRAACGAAHSKKNCLEGTLGFFVSVLPLEKLATVPSGDVHAYAGTPRIESFMPTSGPVGTLVIIKGWSLASATEVTFSGVPALFFVASPTQITASVPERAKTGEVRVVCLGGTASKGTFTVP